MALQVYTADGEELMNTPLDERISALIDDEVGAFEARRLVDEVLASPEMRDRWTRYHLMGDALRNTLPERFDNTLVDRVMARVESESAHTDSAAGRPRSVRPGWAKPVVGLAIAASVAAVSVFSLKTFTGNGEIPAMTAATNVETLAAPVLVQPAGGMVKPVNVGAIIPATARTAPSEPEPARKLYDPRMHSYLATHAEYAAQPGMMSRVRVVGFSAAGEK